MFAGKAALFAEVTVFEGDIILGRTTANEDGDGSWCRARPARASIWCRSDRRARPVKPKLPPDTRHQGRGDGGRAAAGGVAAKRDRYSRALQSPDDKAETNVAAAAVPGSDDGSAQTATVDVAPPPGFDEQPDDDAPVVPALAPRSLSWKTDGALVIDGVSRGGVRVVAAAAGRPFAETAVAEAGAWRMTGKVDAGRASRVMTFALQNGEGAVVATYELPVATRDLSQGLDGSKLVIVQQGDALWRIAYRSYGEGIKYVDIVRRNAAAIDDPDLIFPNQIFAIPE